MLQFDMRLASFITLAKKQEKTILTKEVKEAIRNNDYEVKFDTYGTIKTTSYTETKYTKDGKTIELDTTKIVQDYCEANGIEIVKTSIPNYKVEIIPSEKAKEEYNKMLTEQEKSEYRNIAKVASQLKAHA